MTETPSAPPPSEMRRASPIAMIVATASAMLRGFWIMALTSALAAVVLWGSLFSPIRLAHWWSTALAVALLVVLLSPAAVLFLAAITLTQLAHLPRTLVGQAKDGRDRVVAGLARERDGADGVRPPRIWRLGRTLLDLWALVLDRKRMLLHYAGLVRLANPVSLAIVAVALGAAGMLIGTAAVALVLALF